MRSICVTTLGVLLAACGWGEDWSRFRGPNGSGVTEGTGYPVEFGKGKNLAWRSAVRKGKSSPVLSRRHVFVTAFEEGKLYTQCFDRATGKLEWERMLERPRKEPVHFLNEPASVTPVTDGENVYVFFQDIGLISYDAAGKQRWRTPMGPFTASLGLGASPILHEGLVVMQVDQVDASYVAAFGMKDGELKWKTPRAETESWATPVVHGSQIITTGAGQMGGHLPESGKRAWTKLGLSPAIVASPVVTGDRVYTFGYGYETRPTFESFLQKYDKDGDRRVSAQEVAGDFTEAWYVGIGKYYGNRDGYITEDKWNFVGDLIGKPSSLVAYQMEGGTNGGGAEPKELWRYEKSFIGVVPSPLVRDGVLYVIKNGGILTSFDTETGKVVKTGRVTGALGGYSASPVYAEGRLYLAGEEGKVAVVKAGGQWEVMHVNDLDEPCFATPALSGGRIYVRTGTALYAFGGAQ